MIDPNEILVDYAKGYKDKSRIFFIEHYLSTFNAEKGKKTAFITFPRQKAFLQSLASNKATIAIKPRQAGITTTSAAWIAGQIAYANHDAPETVLCIGNKLDLANQMVTKIKEFLIQVPRWFWGDDYYSPDPKSEKNIKSIFVKDSKSELELFNGCHVYARSSGENAARGISAVSILIFDEAAFIENSTAVYSSAVAATSSVPNSKIIMVSTPNGKDLLYYNTYRQALSHENNYNAVQFRWYQDPRYNKNLKWFKQNDKTGETEWIVETVIDNEGSVKYDEEHWEELVKKGWTPRSPWYETMCQQFNNDSVKIAQELDVSFVGSSDNVVDPEYIEMQEHENVREPLADMKDPYVEETWFWKPPIDGHRYVISCDPSRGSSEDNTAIEVIDMDGRDENGIPILEQVMEYYGKKLGDDIGELLYNYGTLYNNAYVVVDATNGLGDTPLLVLMNKGYRNIFYDDASLKKYTAQMSNFGNKFGDHENIMPGFHMQGNRFSVLSYFANMIRNNEFKVRSIRVINELDTWIFKGEAKRMDHMDGAHDDAITCLAMGLFVMQFSFKRLESAQNKDKAILGAYMMTGSMTARKNTIQDDKPITPKNGLPFYGSKGGNKTNIGNVQGSYLWLFSGYM